MPGMLESEKLNALTQGILKTKIANDFTTATKIAEALLAEDSRLSEGERYFKTAIFNKVTDDLIKWFAGNTFDKEVAHLKEEIESLKKEINELKRGREATPERKTVKRMIEVEEDAETGEVVKQQQVNHSQQQASSMVSSAPLPRGEEPKKATVGAGPGKSDVNPNDYDISKIFYAGGKK